MKQLQPILESVLHDVVKIVNVVKGHALNVCLFGKLRENEKNEYSSLLLDTEVRWLSRGSVLNKVRTLRNETETFLADQKHGLVDKFKHSTGLAFLAYLVDTFGHVNVLNKELQGKNLNIISAKQKTLAFGSKLLYWNQKVFKNKIAAFPKLARL